MRSLPRILLPVVAVALAACGTAAAPTPLAETPPPIRTPAASAAPSSVAVAAAVPASRAPADPAASDGAADPSAGASASARPSSLADMMTPDPLLEATIPHVVNDLQLRIFSLNGKEYLARSADQALRQMIGETPLEPAEVSIAVGVGQTEGKQLAIAAFRFPDVPESRLRVLFREELMTEIPGADVHDATIGGHVVQVIDDPTDQAMPTYLIVEGDTARVVQASAEDLAKAAVGEMP